MKKNKPNSVIQTIVSSFQDREHIRNEIPIRTIMAEIADMRRVLRAGSELVLNPETGAIEPSAIGETRLKEIALHWSINKALIGMVIPAIKPVGVTMSLPKLSKEDMEPMNIRPKMLEHVTTGAITPESAEQVLKVAGAMESEVEDVEPQAFEVNLNLMDARVQRDEHGIIIETDEGEDEDDEGDAFNPVDR